MFIALSIRTARGSHARRFALCYRKNSATEGRARGDKRDKSARPRGKGRGIPLFHIRQEKRIFDFDLQLCDGDFR